MNTETLLELGAVSTDTHGGGWDIDDLGTMQRQMTAPTG